METVKLIKIADKSVRVIPEEDVANQKASLDSLLSQWGGIQPSEADKILEKRETVEPEPDLSPDVVKKLKDRIARSKCSHMKINYLF